MIPGDADAGWFAELRSSFLRGSAERLDAIARLVTLLESRPGDDGLCRDLMQQFHKLAGAGATFGFEAVSRTGREGEALCERRLDGESVEGFLRLCRELHGRLVRDFASGGSAASLTPVALAGIPGAADVLVVEDDDDLREAIVARLVASDLRPRSAITLEEGRDAVRRRLPEALVADIRLPDGSGYDLIEEVRRLPGGDATAIVAVSARAALLDRVQALRSGADVSFPKPLDLGALVERLGELLERAHADLPRVLAVEDDPDQGAFLRTLLTSAGYSLRLCEEPRNLEADIIAFAPDVVLMDVLLPGASGYDLVRFLRQDPRFSSIPVLVVTSEGRLDDRIRSTRAGGDDHLVKPVSPALLLASVAARVERARALRKSVERDGLTGLLTRSAFLERIDARLAKLQRRGDASAVFVMLDLDRFHELNERYGHPEGDRVLASLGQLLRRRLRRSDVMGRYGGEEFALLLDDLGEEEAVSLIDRIRIEFVATHFGTTKGESFGASFSAGLAAWDPFLRDAVGWIAAADEALYRSKGAGRGRVTGASAR